VNLRTFRSVLRHYLDARVAVQLISAPGLGKSETVEDSVEQFAREDGHPWGLCTIMAACLTPPDVLGYLVPSSRKINVAGPGGRMVEQTIQTSEFTMPPWLMSNSGEPMNSYKRGLIFFDEWDKVDPDTKRALAQVVLKGVAGNWAAHEGIGIVTAANRAEDRSGSTKEYDFIINRRAEIHIVPDVDSWEDWAVRHGIDPLYTAFAKRNIDVVFSGKVPDKQGPYCTPRTLVMMSHLLSRFADKHGSLPVDDQKQRSIMSEMASGLIGAPAANHFLTWCQMKTEVPDFETIVANPETAEIPKKPDGKMLVAYDCAHRLTEATADKVVTYALRLPKDFQLTFGAAAIKKNFKMLAHPAFMDRFTPENAGLIGLVSA